MSLLDHPTRRLALVGRLAETWVHRPPSPTRVVLDVTRRCNLRCRMCHTWRAPSEGELTLSELDALLSSLPRLVWLDVTGGEPFVRRDAQELLGLAMQRPPALQVLHFQTNGWATDRIVEATAATRAQRTGVELIVTVSIDGPPSVHDAIRGRPGSFERALATLRALWALPGVEVHVGTTITPDNADAIDELLECLLDAVPGFHARRWHFNWAQVSRHFYGNEHVRAWPKVPPAGLLSRLRRRRGPPTGLVELMEQLYLLHLEFVQRGEPSGIPCQALRSTLFVSPEGELYPCHLYDRPLGNLREHDLATLWASPAVAAARRDIEALACGGCFSACEAYPALAGAPVATVRQTARRALTLWNERRAHGPRDEIG
ncbi:radical SAM/SPASM domain-containing protein [Paraliomyxa miuraensis]|uniref:radical SAM/SPASM domain-containing protein n=1 Tax=Paraliomyxa miuraensis TaxID=376150 RepID=UPI002251A5CA|nr:radical SAM protein [Paraliomyxa miuraensis]MCX4241962.1 radical SAM protein [Paraliomyxa miuraensis]